MWQITLYELDEDKVKPKKAYNSPSGTFHYSCGICGEHGGEPSSVKFCAKVGMDYASCSPFRVPIARLAAAQAAVEE